MVMVMVMVMVNVMVITSVIIITIIIVIFTVKVMVKVGIISLNIPSLQVHSITARSVSREFREGLKAGKTPLSDTIFKVGPRTLI